MAGHGMVFSDFRRRRAISQGTMAAITHASIQGLFQFNQAIGKGPRIVTGIQKTPAARGIDPRCQEPLGSIPPIRRSVAS